MDEKQIDKQENQAPEENKDTTVRLEKSDVDEVSGGVKEPIVTPEI